MDCTGAMIDEKTLRLAFQSLAQVQLGATSIHLHPVQLLPLINLVKMEVADKTQEHPYHSFRGLRIMENPLMPPDTIELLDAEGKVLTRIVHLAVPEER